MYRVLLHAKENGKFLHRFISVNLNGSFTRGVKVLQSNKINSESIASSSRSVKPCISFPVRSINNINNKNNFNEITYEHVSNETLESLNEVLEELIEQNEAPSDSDITLSAGVLTLQLGELGTYVINKQTPNKQIWLSSPISGPKRFDFHENHWIYKHDGSSLHQLLSLELSRLLKIDINLESCEYGRKDLN